MAELYPSTDPDETFGIDTEDVLRCEILAPYPDDTLYDLSNPQDRKAAEERFGDCTKRCLGRAAARSGRVAAS